MGFVWFHNSSKQPQNAVQFYQKLLGWTQADGPPGMTMFAGASGPFAGVAAQEHNHTGWIP
jgi:predicted enzyme related to lactoylglutathione lyase